MAIRKLTQTIEVMFDDAIYSESAVLGMGLDELLGESEDGFLIRAPTTNPVCVEVPADEVDAALKAWGNDGTFFNEVE